MEENNNNSALTNVENYKQSLIKKTTTSESLKHKLPLTMKVIKYYISDKVGDLTINDKGVK